MTKLMSLIAVSVFLNVACASVDAAESKSGRAAYAKCMKDVRRDGPSSNPVGNRSATRREIAARNLCKARFATELTASR
jgi:hypothetical protein